MLLSSSLEAGTQTPSEVWKRFAEKEVTHSMVHYLQAIAGLKREKGFAKVSDIASRLGVSRAGVTSMLRTLKARGLAVHERYGLVELTDEGVRFAKMTEANRAVLTQFFSDILRLPVATAGEDACMIEHLVSPESMVQFLRLTALIQSDHPAAERFRAAFKEYQDTCETGVVHEECPVCHGSCLREQLGEIEPPEKPRTPGRKAR